MIRNLTMACIAVGCAGQAHAALTLTPGNILTSNQNNGVIREINPATGAIVGSLQLVRSNGTNATLVHDIALWNGELWAVVNNFVSRVDPATGALTTTTLEFDKDIMSRDGRLVVRPAGQLIHEYDTSPQLVNQFQMGFPNESFNWNNVTALGWNEAGQRFASAYQGGTGLTATIDFYSAAGVPSPADFLDIPRGAGDLQRIVSGIDFDPAGNMWVSWRNINLSNFNANNGAVQMFAPGATTASLTLQLTGQGATSDVIYIVPAPGGVGVGALVAGLLARRRRRADLSAPVFA